MSKSPKKLALNRLADPTMQGMNRKDADKKIQLIIKMLTQSMDTWLADVSYVIRNDGTYLYEIPSPKEANDHFEALFLAALLLGGRRFFLEQNIDAAFRSGVNYSMSHLNRDLIKLYRQGITGFEQLEPEMIYLNPEYQKAYEIALSEAETGSKSIMTDESTKVGRIILAGMMAGLALEEIRASVTKELKKASDRLKRIAVTSINRGNDESRITTGEIVAGMLIGAGLVNRVMHISAWLPTTRPHHAARHKKVYTAQEQRAWWNEGANRINCHCSVVPMLVSVD